MYASPAPPGRCCGNPTARSSSSAAPAGGSRSRPLRSAVPSMPPAPPSPRRWPTAARPTGCRSTPSIRATWKPSDLSPLRPIEHTGQSEADVREWHRTGHQRHPLRHTAGHCRPCGLHGVAARPLASRRHHRHGRRRGSDGVRRRKPGGRGAHSLRTMGLNRSKSAKFRRSHAGPLPAPRYPTRHAPRGYGFPPIGAHHRLRSA